MTEKDLIKINVFLDRVQELPSDATLKNKILWNKSTEEDRESFLEAMKEIGRIIVELTAFLKVRFGESSNYVLRLGKIDFITTKSHGIKYFTNDQSANNEAWQSALSELRYLIYEIRAEIIEILDTQPDKLKKFQEKESRFYKIIGSFLFIVMTFSLPGVGAWYFLRTLVQWDTLNVWDPSSWVDVGEFAKLEFLFSGFELVILGTSIWIYRNYKDKFINWFYDAVKIK